MNTSAPSALAEILQPATLLIVDAEPVFREFEARTLSDRGYTVLKASGMEEALRLADASGAIHLLLTEFPSLRADFPELTEQFRTMHPAAPVLLVLGALEKIDEGVHNLGRIGVMAKPFTLDELTANVQHLLTQPAPLPCQRPGPISVQNAWCSRWAHARRMVPCLCRRGSSPTSRLQPAWIKGVATSGLKLAGF